MYNDRSLDLVSIFLLMISAVFDSWIFYFLCSSGLLLYIKLLYDKLCFAFATFISLVNIFLSVCLTFLCITPVSTTPLYALP